MWRTDWSLGHFTSWTLKLLKFHLVFTFSSLPLDCKKCEEHLGYFVIVFTTYVWHGPGGDQVEDWAQTRTSPSLWSVDQAARAQEHSLFWASLLSLGRECEYSTPGWGGDWFVLDTDTETQTLTHCAHPVRHWVLSVCWCRPHRGHDCQGLCPQPKTLFKWTHDDRVINTVLDNSSLLRPRYSASAAGEQLPCSNNI